jgi:predicted ferric reductase
MHFLKDFITYNRSWSIQAGVFIGLAVYVWLSTFKLFIDVSISFAIARSCGAVLKIVLMPSIIVPTSRVLYTEIRNSKIGRFLGLDRRIADHKIFATAAGIFAIIHMIAHYFHNKNNFAKQSGITGIIMLLSLAVPLAGVFLARKFSECIKKYSYSTQILRPHQIGAVVFIAAYAFHTSDGRLIYYAIPMYGSYLFDRILEYFKHSYVTKIDSAIRVNHNFIMLNIQKPINFVQSLPGQFAMLSFKEIDKSLECYHPFTIVNDDGKTLSFLIQKTGEWTTNL